MKAISNICVLACVTQNQSLSGSICLTLRNSAQILGNKHVESGDPLQMNGIVVVVSSENRKKNVVTCGLKQNLLVLKRGVLFIYN